MRVDGVMQTNSMWHVERSDERASGPVSGVVPRPARLSKRARPQLEQFLHLAPLLLDDLQELIGQLTASDGSNPAEVAARVHTLARVSESAKLPRFSQVVSALGVYFALREQHILPPHASDWLFLAIMMRALEGMLDNIERDLSEQNCALEVTESNAALARYQPLVYAMSARPAE